MQRNLTALILDGSLAPGCVARLSLRGPEAGTIQSAEAGDPERSLIERIAALVPSEASRAELAAVVVGIGPGSYTGIRAASAAAAGVAVALQIPIITVPSDRALYAAAQHTGGDAVVLPLGTREVLVIRESESVIAAHADAPPSANLALVALHLPRAFAQLAETELRDALVAADRGARWQRRDIQLRYPSPPRGAEQRGF